ncbi:MAG: translocation/assembly module TamB domain-containing protein [Crocinitomicaceae bacterium]
MILLLVFLVIAIRTSWFQTWLAHQASWYLTKELGTEVRIDKVDIVFIDKVDIEGVYIEDIQKDTFLYTQLIHADIADWSLKESFVKLSNVTLNEGHIHIRKYLGDSTLNFQHIVDYFATESEDTTSSEFAINIQAIQLNDMHFIYQDQNADTLPNGLDFSNLEFSHFSGAFSDFRMMGPQIAINLENLQFEDRSGLKLTKLSTDLSYGPQAISLKKLKLALNQTYLYADYLELLTPNGAEDFNDFMDDVKFNAHIKNSTLSFGDLAFFVPSIWGMNDKLKINNIEVSGPIHGMKLKNVDLAMLDTTRIKGNFQIPDLDDIKSSFFEEEIELFRTSISDLKKLNLKPLMDKKAYEDMMKNLNQYAAADVIRLENGRYIGYLSDFVVDGDLYTGVGDISSEYGLKFIYNENDGLYHYTGAQGDVGKHIEVRGLNMGVIAKNDIMDNVSGYLKVKGKGFDEKSLDIEFSGLLQNVGIYGYDYANILVKKGHFARNVFTGVIDIKDDNLALNYDGMVDLNGMMHFDFDITIDSAHVAQLTKKEQQLYQSLATSVSVNVYGTGMNEFYGDVAVRNFAYKDEKVDLNMKELTLHVSRQDEADTIVLRSPYVDMDLTGKYDLNDVAHVLIDQFAYVIDNLVEPDKNYAGKQEFYSLDIRLKDVNPLLAMVDENLKIATNSQIRSEFSQVEKSFALDFNSDSISYGKMRFEEINFDNNFDSLKANMYYEVDYVQINDSLAVRDLYFDSYAKKNKFVTTTGWDGVGKMEPALLAFETEVSKRKDLLTVFRPSFFFLQGHKYNIKRDSKVLWNPEEIVIEEFNIYGESNYIQLDGIISEDPKDWLGIEIHDFDLSDLNGLVGDLELAGIVNINGRAADVYNAIRLEAEADIKDLYLNQQKVGDIGLITKYAAETKSLDVSGELWRDNIKTFGFSGDYFIERKSDNINLIVDFDKTDISFLNAFEDPYLYTNISGILDGELKITGELESPIITGVLDVVTAKLKVPMFNVFYGLSGKIKFNDGEMISDHLTVFDQEGNKADAQMQIYHYDWADWNYNINLDIDNPNITKQFLAMDTYYKEGDYYYGKAYVTGFVGIFGYDDMTEIEVDLKTKKGTSLVLPMYGSSDLEEGSFVIFDSTFFLPDSLKNQDVANDVNEVSRLGMTLAMKFHVTKDAEVKIVFDPLTEDQIVSKGTGDIEINMDDFGDMTMYGEYIIRDGAYEMRMKGIKEDFLLQDGGTVQWTGTPYDAYLNINAQFVRTVSMADIIPPEAGNARNRKDVVYGLLKMRNTLMDPKISFGIEAPETNELGAKALAEINGNVDELNKQFLSLLVLRKFIPRYGGGAGGSDAMLGLAESQINSLLSGMSEKVNLEVGLSEDTKTIGQTAQLNERTTIKTSFGVLTGEEASSDGGNFVGDVDIEYRLNDDGTFTMNFFNETNSSSSTAQGRFTQGVSLHYQETFNTTKQFRAWQKFLNVFRKKENRVNFEKINRRSEKWVPIPTDSTSTN